MLRCPHSVTVNSATTVFREDVDIAPTIVDYHADIMLLWFVAFIVV